jgi:hypothetical protein
MTRVYQRPDEGAPGEARTRALVIGAGRYPHAKRTNPNIPALADLSSVGPSVSDFVAKLIHDWGSDLAAPLGTVDLLISDGASPGGAPWRALGVPGEAADGTRLEAPTLANVNAALNAWLLAAEPKDHLLFLCCGHGFWKDERCFVLADFGANVNNPWTSVIALDSFALGLRQQPPRTQWLFFDCCSDMPELVLTSLGTVGDPLIRLTAKGLATAQQQFGPVSQFGLASSTIGTQAFGIPDRPSRFCEMLIDALDGAGAVFHQYGTWWIDQRGIEDAVKSYAARKPDLQDPAFYEFVTPISSDAPGRMRFRRVADEPRSRLIAKSIPPIALKNATVVIKREGADKPSFTLLPPQRRAKLHVDLVPARQHYTVTATFGGITKQIEIFADLPLAERAEFILP